MEAAADGTRRTVSITLGCPGLTHVGLRHTHALTLVADAVAVATCTQHSC